MRRSFICFVIGAALFTACADSQSKPAEKSASTSSAAKGLTEIQWIDSAKNLGKISEGQTVEVAFRFKNVGNKPLVVEAVRPGCGCTVADPPKEPIAPGAEGVIKGSFNSDGRPGVNNKNIHVEANVPNSPLNITFTVEVIPKQTK